LVRQPRTSHRPVRQPSTSHIRDRKDRDLEVGYQPVYLVICDYIHDGSSSERIAFPFQGKARACYGICTKLTDRGRKHSFVAIISSAVTARGQMRSELVQGLQEKKLGRKTSPIRETREIRRRNGFRRFPHRMKIRQWAANS
jgi:hypothetical protein